MTRKEAGTTMYRLRKAETYAEQVRKETERKRLIEITREGQYKVERYKEELFRDPLSLATVTLDLIDGQLHGRCSCPAFKDMVSQMRSEEALPACDHIVAVLIFQSALHALEE